MGFLGTELSYKFLRWKYPRGEGGLMATGEGVEDSAPTQSKLDLLWGPEFYSAIQGKVVADFGCGLGWECLEMAAAGARKSSVLTL